MAERIGSPDNARGLNVLFIGGPGRSGSTLLDRMLGQVPGVVSVGELRYIWESGFRQAQACACGQPFDACPFWQSVAHRMFGGNAAALGEEMAQLSRRVDRPRYIPLILLRHKPGQFRGRLQAYRNALGSLLAAIREEAGADLIVDSSKEPASAFLLSTMNAVNLRLLHLVRDSRAATYSWTRKKLIDPRADANGAPRLLNWSHPWTNSWVWNYRNAGIEFLGSDNSFAKNSAVLEQPSYLRVRYEDLIPRPEETLTEILSFAGIKNPDLSFLSGNQIELKATHTVSGNPMRFQHGVMDLKLDDEWRRKMSRSHRWIVTAITYPYLLKYHYL